MSDYIKREDAIKSIMAHDPAIEIGESGSRAWAEYLLENATTADVVEVIRCKDCKWNGAKDEDEGDCAMMEYKHNGDDYCSYGERKDDE